MTNLTRRIRSFKGDWNDPSDWLGKPCMVTIVPNKNRPEYVKIDGASGVGSVPEGLPVAELQNTPSFFDLENPDLDVFLSFPEFKQEMIKENLEFEGSKLQSELDRVS